MESLITAAAAHCDARVGGSFLTDTPYPHAAENDVIVQVHAAGFTPGALYWPAVIAWRGTAEPGEHAVGL